LTCLDFIKFIAIKKRHVEHLKNVQLPHENLSLESRFLKFLKYPGYILSLLSTVGNNVGCIILIHTGAIKTFRVVFDASYLGLSNNVQVLYLRKNGSRIKCASSKYKFLANVNLITPAFDGKKNNLFDIGNFFPIEENNVTAIVEYLAAHNIENLILKFVTSPSNPFYAVVLYNSTIKGESFRELTGFYDNNRKLKFNLVEKVATKVQVPLITINNEFIGNEFKKRNNRHTSIYIQDQGLNLAKRIGIINHTEFVALSESMTKFCGFFTFKATNKKGGNELEEIVYCDFLMNCTTSFTNCNLNEFFDLIESRAPIINQLKLKCLSFLFKRLANFTSSANSVYKKCLFYLKQFCSKFKCFTFGTDDYIMHALKLPMAIYYKEKFPTSKRSVFLKCSKGNDILALSYKHVLITNINQIVGTIANSDPTMTCNILKQTILMWTGNYENDLAALYCCVNNFCLQHFDLDLTTLAFLSMANISNLIFWNLYIKNCNGSWLVHPIEQTLNYNVGKLREYCKGGYSFSAKREITCGDLIDTTTKAKSLINLDIVASYGYAASNISAACGFGSTFENGQRLESSQRYKFFEFRAVFYTIYTWEILEKRQIKVVYSNYTSCGVFYIGKYPIDLVAIFQDGSLEIVQFDSAYCHGCNCCNLPSYASGKTKQELMTRTRDRDQFTLKWIKDTGVKAKYRICTDCCNPLFKKSFLDFQFKTVPELKRLISGYSSIISDNLNNVHSEITFIAIAELEENFPTFLASKTTLEKKKLLLTSDYYNYIKINWPQIKIINVEWVIFYKKDYIFNTVYKHLLNGRESSLENVKQFYKNVINLSCGYFGTNLAKGNARSLRITNNTPANFNLNNYSIITLEPNSQDLYIIKTNLTGQKLKNLSSASSFSLIHFAMIIEYGKMRLDKIFNFYYTYFEPNSFKILYAHIDSTILVFSTDTIEEAVKNYHQFVQYKSQIFGDSVPGNLKIVWHVKSTDRWSFVTCRQSSYALLTDSFSTSKMPNISDTHAKNVYEAQRKLLTNKKCTIDQKRRKNKLIGPTSIINQTFNLSM